jgi:hypothetical protein
MAASAVCQWRVRVQSRGARKPGHDEGSPIQSRTTHMRHWRPKHYFVGLASEVFQISSFDSYAAAFFPLGSRVRWRELVSLFGR